MADGAAESQSGGPSQGLLAPPPRPWITALRILGEPLLNGLRMPDKANGQSDIDAILARPN